MEIQVLIVASGPQRILKSIPSPSAFQGSRYCPIINGPLVGGPTNTRA